MVNSDFLILKLTEKALGKGQPLEPRFANRRSAKAILHVDI